MKPATKMFAGLRSVQRSPNLLHVAIVEDED